MPRSRPLGPRSLLVLAVSVLLFVAGCATPQTTRLLEEPAGLPASAELASVPFIPQERYYCGPAALAMVLSWSGLEVTQQEIAEEVYTPGRQGTLRADVLAAARRHGRLAVPVQDVRSVLREIAAGHPVIVFQNLALGWFPQWHFAVAIGYDLEAGEIILHSGLEPRRKMGLRTFERTWDRGGYWALVVLPPDELPVSATELASLRAAAGLERLGHDEAAASAYETIAARWPATLGGHMGLGNVRYAMGDLAGAEAAFRTAVATHPEAPEPWNNLAHVLAEAGRLDAAAEAAGQAVLRGGPETKIYRDTLRDIHARAAEDALRRRRVGS